MAARNTNAFIPLQQLGQAIASAGGRVVSRAGAGEDAPDLVFAVGERHFVVELKSASANRVEVLEGLMAAALLRARRHSDARGAIALPVLSVKQLTERSHAAVGRFMAREAPRTPWGMIDGHGRRVFHELAGIELHSEGTPRAPHNTSRPRERDPFSDLGQWMAKVLVAPRVPQRLLAAPRRNKLQRARHLARAAGVSEPTAARWVKLLRGHGFIDDSSGELRIVRASEFFERWRRAVSAVPRHEVPARFSLPSGTADAQLRQALAAHSFQRVAESEPDRPDVFDTSIRWNSKPRACLALFEAAAALGRGHVMGSPTHLYLESITDETLRSFGLERAAPERAQLRIIEPTWPESVFRAAVMVHTRDSLDVPACDIVQAWLDVSDHPARGREQAEEIERDVLDKYVFAESDNVARS